MTFRQVAYAISDFSKTIADDSIITIDHILFVMSKYRNYILNSQFANMKKQPSDSNYQQICVSLSTDDLLPDFCGKEVVLRSTEKVPYMMASLGAHTVYPPAGFMYGNFQLVNNTKFKYSGHSQFLKNMVYVTIGPDDHLYLKSQSRDFSYIPKVIISAIFEDPEKAALMECDSKGECADNCDLLDKRFPLDDSYLPLLMQFCVRDITGAAWKPSDDINNAADDLSRFAQVLNRYTTQSFKNQMNSQPDKDEPQL